MSLFAYAFAGAVVAGGVAAVIAILLVVAWQAGEFVEKKLGASFAANLAVTVIVLFAEVGFVFGCFAYLLKGAA